MLYVLVVGLNVCPFGLKVSKPSKYNPEFNGSVTVKDCLKEYLYRWLFSCWH